jgi:hypothetical protein
MWGTHKPIQIVFLRLKNLLAQVHDMNSCLIACPEGEIGARFVTIYSSISDVLRNMGSILPPNCADKVHTIKVLPKEF